MIQSGKLLAILQSDPTRKDRTIATVFMTLAVESDVLEKKKEFERVPVLRNLVPAQVLMGNSSFNSGQVDQRRTAGLRAQPHRSDRGGAANCELHSDRARSRIPHPPEALPGMTQRREALA